MRAGASPSRTSPLLVALQPDIRAACAGTTTTSPPTRASCARRASATPRRARGSCAARSATTSCWARPACPRRASPRPWPPSTCDPARSSCPAAWTRGLRRASPPSYRAPAPAARAGAHALQARGHVNVVDECGSSIDATTARASWTRPPRPLAGRMDRRVAQPDAGREGLRRGVEGHVEIGELELATGRRVPDLEGARARERR